MPLSLTYSQISKSNSQLENPSESIKIPQVKNSPNLGSNQKEVLISPKETQNPTLELTEILPQNKNILGNRGSILSIE